MKRTAAIGAAGVGIFTTDSHAASFPAIDNRYASRNIGNQPVDVPLVAALLINRGPLPFSSDEHSMDSEWVRTFDPPNSRALVAATDKFA
jgi:hypothetical protein